MTTSISSAAGDGLPSATHTKPTSGCANPRTKSPMPSEAVDQAVAVNAALVPLNTLLAAGGVHV